MFKLSMSTGQKSIRELLVEMKDTSDWMVDLSLASIYFEDENLAKFVHSLESKMDDLTYEFFQCAAVVSRSREEARRMVSLMQIAASAENISNATGDLSSLVLRKVGIHPVLKEALAMAGERLARIRVREGSHLAGKELGQLRLPSSMGVWVLARRRGEEYEIPNKKTLLEAGDLLVVKGPPEGIQRIHKIAGEPITPLKPSPKLRGLKKTLAEMRDAAVLSVDLAYSSVLLNLTEPAELVREIETKFDRLSYKLWAETLKAAKKEGERGLTSVLETVRCLERITDSADSIVDFILRGIEPHPVLTEAMSEVNEKISRVQVRPGSVLENRSIGELDLWATTGVYVLFIQRGEKFLYTPGRKTRIVAGDLLVLRGAYAGIEKMKKLAEVSVPEA
jgi:uncharacterized protein with PhoU and TrkA domain